MVLVSAWRALGRLLSPEETWRSLVLLVLESSSRLRWESPLANAGTCEKPKAVGARDKRLTESNNFDRGQRLVLRGRTSLEDDRVAHATLVSRRLEPKGVRFVCDVCGGCRADTETEMTNERRTRAGDLWSPYAGQASWTGSSSTLYWPC